MYCKASN